MMLDLLDLELTNLQEIANALHDGFMAGDFVTKLGPGLVAVNPMGVTKDFRSVVPALKDFTYRLIENVRSGIDSQIVVVQGESGAGKSTITNTIIGNLGTALCDELGIGIGLPTKLEMANTLLHAFGHATTPLNKDSSRFAKSVTLAIDQESHRVLGARIQTFLLERSRTYQAHLNDYDSNFHALHSLPDRASRYPELRLGDSFTILNCGAHKQNPTAWEDVMVAMNGLTGESDSPWLANLVAGMLHLGNFDGHDTPEQKEILQQVAACWNIPKQVLPVLFFQLGGTDRIRGPVQVITLRNSVMSAVHAALFQRIVQITNQTLCPKGNSGRDCRHISILDTAGLESFEGVGQPNSLEQLFVNHMSEELKEATNSNLQQYHWQDLIQAGVLDTIPPHHTRVNTGLAATKTFSEILDEEARHPTRNIDHLLNRLSQSQSVALEKSGSRIIIHHSNGAVSYALEGIVEKNRASSQHDIRRALMTTSNVSLREVFACIIDRSLRGNDPHTAATDRDIVDLKGFLAHGSVTPIYCLKPSTQQAGSHDQGIGSPWNFNHVKSQLMGFGLTDVVEVLKGSYPERMSMKTFLLRFCDPADVTEVSVRELISEHLSEHLDRKAYQLGIDTVYMKGGSLSQLTRAFDESKDFQPALACISEHDRTVGKSPTGSEIDPAESFNNTSMISDFDGVGEESAVDFTIIGAKMNDDIPRAQAQVLLQQQEEIERLQAAERVTAAKLDDQARNLVSIISERDQALRLVASGEEEAFRLRREVAKNERRISVLSSSVASLTEDNDRLSEQLNDTRAAVLDLETDLSTCQALNETRGRHLKSITCREQQTLLDLLSCFSAPDIPDQNLRSVSPGHVVAVLSSKILILWGDGGATRENKEMFVKLRAAITSLAKRGGGGYRARLLACNLVNTMTIDLSSQSNAWAMSGLESLSRHLQEELELMIIKKFASTIKNNCSTFNAETLVRELKKLCNACGQYSYPTASLDRMLTAIYQLVSEAVSANKATAISEKDLSAVKLCTLAPHYVY